MPARTPRTLRQRFFERCATHQQTIRSKAQAVARALPRERIRSAVARLEIPTCDCKVTYQRVCAHQREAEPPCTRGRECDCSWHAVLCPHVVDRLAEISVEDWAALLLALDPQEYDEPPPPETPALALSQEARVELMAARRDVCVCGSCRRDPLDPERWVEPRQCDGLGLRHAGDEVGQADLKVGLLPVTLRNGEGGGKVERAGRDRNGRVGAQRISLGVLSG